MPVGARVQRHAGTLPPDLAQERDGLGVEERLAEVVEEQLLDPGELLYDVEHHLEREPVQAIFSVIGGRLGDARGRAPRTTQVTVRYRLKLEHPDHSSSLAVQSTRRGNPTTTAGADDRAIRVGARDQLPASESHGREAHCTGR